MFSCIYVIFVGDPLDTSESAHVSSPSFCFFLKSKASLLVKTFYQSKRPQPREVSQKSPKQLIPFMMLSTSCAWSYKEAVPHMMGRTRSTNRACELTVSFLFCKSICYIKKGMKTKTHHFFSEPKIFVKLSLSLGKSGTRYQGNFSYLIIFPFLQKAVTHSWIQAI